MTSTRYSQPKETVVEVFKTNVEEVSLAKSLVRELLLHLPDCRITFDLEDCDNILRVEGKEVNPELVEHLVTEKGIACKVLE